MPVAPTKETTFDGIAEGGTITVASTATGSGDQIAGVGTTAATALAAAAIRGARGARFSGAAVTSFVQHTFAGTGPVYAMRCPFFVPVTPFPNACDFGQLRNSASPMCNFRLTTANVLQVNDAAGTLKSNVNSGAALPSGWYVGTLVAIPGTTTTNGRMGWYVRKWSDDSMVTNGSGDTGATANTGTTAGSIARYGKTAATGTYAIDMDEIGLYEGSTFDEILRPGQSANTPPVVNAGVDTSVDPMLVDTFNLVSIESDDVAVVSGEWRDITGGAPGTLLGTTATLSQPVVRNANGATRTYRRSATDAGGLTTPDDVTVTFLPHTRWMMTSGGLVPVRRGA